MKLKLIAILIFLFDALAFTHQAFARGGGGGSGGGGGGGGFSGGHAGRGGSGGKFDWFSFIIFIAILIFFGLVSYYKNKKQREDELKTQDNIVQKEKLDIGAFKARAEEIFYKFQAAWGNFDVAAMQTVVTESYYKRMVLELNVLQNESRANPMSDLQISDITLIGKEVDEENDTELIVKISASAHDVLMDIAENKQLFADDSDFTEYWHLEKENGVWKLDLITQDTEDPALVENEISAFAKANGFYFDPDFGWLMMPNKGTLFKQTDFGRSDINNHVVGYFRDKIVEFYTYIPKTDNRTPKNFLIAQAILPKAYKNILIKRKKWINLPVRGLKRIQLESVDFNNKFCLWADPQDQVNSLELLTPNFMEKIYQLPFELNIELVGNFLYFYTKDRGAANYPKMLEVLSWAFDEMKI